MPACSRRSDREPAFGGGSDTAPGSGGRSETTRSGFMNTRNYNSKRGRFAPCPMVISKKVEFSASHICRSPALSDAENQRTYGAAANPMGHGHNYVVEVAIEGEPDPVTGMILDLKRLKDILEER